MPPALARVGRWGIGSRKAPGFGGRVGWGPASGLPPMPAVLLGLALRDFVPFELTGVPKGLRGHTPVFTMLNADLDVEKH